MSDGAHMGITAGRALGTVIGGEEQPTQEERATPKEVRARIEGAPLFEGPQPWKDVDASLIEPTEERMNAYSLATDSIAHAFLVLIEEDKHLLDPEHYPTDHEVEILRGTRKSPESRVWSAMKERWPHADEWVGGASGFMVGFALNTALYVLGDDYAGNPALMTIGPKEE